LSNQFSRTGILLVISAPSGAGKSTLCGALRKAFDFVYSVSCTTRPPRTSEVEGKDYYFLSESDFKARVDAGEFLEYAQVHTNFYGTLRKPLVANLENGRDVLIDVDTQGAATIRSSRDPAIQQALCDVFILPPSLDELRRRLAKRGTETDTQIELRIETAIREIELWRDYRYTIITGSIEEDLQKVQSIVNAERHLSRRLTLS
jgi:guanylate kinase